MEKFLEATDFFTTFNEKNKQFQFGKVLRIIDGVLNDLRIKYPDIFTELTRLMPEDKKLSVDITSTVKKYNLRLLSFMMKCDENPACKKYMRYLVALYEFLNNDATTISVKKSEEPKINFTNELQMSNITVKIKNTFDSMYNLEPLFRVVRNMMHSRKQNPSFYSKYDNDRYKQKMANLLIYAFQTDEGRSENFKLHEKLAISNRSTINNDLSFENNITKENFEEIVFKMLLKSISEISIQSELYFRNFYYSENVDPIFTSFKM